MIRNRSIWIQLIAVTELAAAAPWTGIYLMWWRIRDYENVDVVTKILCVEGIIFLMAPAISLVAAILRKNWARYTLMIFPILAFIHGISAVPLLAHIVPIGGVRTILLLLINGGVILLLALLRPEVAEHRHA